MDPAAEPVLEASYVEHVGGSGGVEVPTWFVWVGRDTDVEVRVGGLFLTPSYSRGGIWVYKVG